MPEFTLGQSFVAKPESRAIIEQYLDGCASFVAKNKAMPAEWVKMKLASANCGIAIDAFPEINRLASNVNFVRMRDT